MWATTYPKGCRNNNPVSIAASVMNVATDLVIFVLPLPSLLSLQLNRKNQGIFSKENPGGICWWIADPS